MFPEYRELISKLKGNHSRFDTLFEKHNKLDHDIKRLESLPSSNSMEIVNLKLEQLEIKREIRKNS
ncbi:YdcH family protein [Escherichia coli]